MSTSTSTNANTNIITEQGKNLNLNTTASPGKSPKPLSESASGSINTSTTTLTSIGSTQPLHLSHSSSDESSSANITAGMEFSPKNLSTTSPSTNTQINTESNTTTSTNQGSSSSIQKQPSLKNTKPMESQAQNQKDLNERQEILQESKTNLVINYIPADMNEGTLGTLFSPYGTMLNIKIVVDPHTGRSRGYGFVKYESEESARQAQEALNGMVIGNKKLKVAYSRPQSKDIQNSNLYVTNVPLDWKNQQLGEVFKPFGYVVESRILVDQDGKSRGVGFVRMDSHANALKAISGTQGVSELVVKLAQKKNQNRRWGTNLTGGDNNMNQGNEYENRTFGHRNQGRRSGGMYNNQGGDHNRNVFQGQTPSGAYGKRNSSDRRQFYRPRGGPMGDPSSSGEGFYPPSHHPFVQPVTGVEPYYATHGMSSNTMREPSTGSSGRAQTNTRGYSPQSYNIVVQNLPEHYNVDHLIKLYAPYGPIQSVHIQKSGRHSNGKPQTSYGIVSYFFADDAKNAIEQTDHRQEGNRVLHVTWQ